MPELHVRQDGADVLVPIKAVPGASRDEIAGMVGDRLKVRISAPPEGGKANKAICRFLAKALEVKAKDVSIESGRTGAEKTVRIAGAAVQDVRAQLAPS